MGSFPTKLLPKPEETRTQTSSVITSRLIQKPCFTVSRQLHTCLKPPTTIQLPPKVEKFKYYYDQYKDKDLSQLDIRLSQNIDIRIKECDKQIEQNQFDITLNEIKTNYTNSNHLPTSNKASTLNSFINLDSWFKTKKTIFDVLCPQKSIKPILDDKKLAIVRQASNPYPQDEVLAELEGIPITRKDIQTLQRLNWLNDEVINFYLNLIVQRSQIQPFKKTYTYNTFFYSRLRDSGYSSIKRWTRKVDIFKSCYLLIPIHLGNHWCLGFIDIAKKKIAYYDSLGGSTHGCCDILLGYLKDESRDKRKVELDSENWTFINAYQSNIPTQTNGSDCGVFACTYAEYLTREVKLDFSQEDMPYFRKKMIYEIVSKQLLDFFG